ncbi:uncharacterized protein ATNIH1004_010680 [Aspergillus tanneri]|uniref:Uncharacterized protein n=1 Tax=Aspergillus tanneri TaxID=1220188 RepID=A0A5M9M4W1_9EURO|nr:uncharacterized protein ATNIH1004_010680 [Aspergillus tanneri]KAA8641741.1 hypothetical protein ATNIH1004_010680 [Aspergillus tanneri]
MAGRIPSPPGAAEYVVSRPVTELPADLPSVIARWREEGSQLDGENLPSSETTKPELPEGEAGSLLADKRPPRSRPGTSRQQSKPAGLRKSRMKYRLTLQDINRAGTRDAAIADELWDRIDDSYNAQEEAADNASRRAWSRTGEKWVASWMMGAYHGLAVVV